MLRLISRSIKKKFFSTWPNFFLLWPKLKFSADGRTKKSSLSRWSWRPLIGLSPLVAEIEISKIWNGEKKGLTATRGPIGKTCSRDFGQTIRHFGHKRHDLTTVTRLASDVPSAISATRGKKLPWQ